MILPEVAILAVAILIILCLGLATAAVLYSSSRRSIQSPFRPVTDLIAMDERYSHRPESIIQIQHSHTMQTFPKRNAGGPRNVMKPPPDESSIDILEIPDLVVKPSSDASVIDVLDIPELPVTPLSEESIIDVTGSASKISVVPDDSNLIKFPGGVPYWQHQYVYSASELQYASEAQKSFYGQFRSAFVKGTYYDVEGNSNYAFILLFDLVDSYNVGPQAGQLIEWLTNLGELYPKTGRYIYSSLERRMREINDWGGIKQIQELQDSGQYWVGYDYDYWRLGSKVKKRLGLNKDEASLLNRLTDARNTFLDIEYCCDQVILLFLKTVSDVRSAFDGSGPGLDQRILALADIIAKKHYRYRANSENYRYGLRFISDQLYTLIFKRCENAVRQRYDHKRKLNATPGYSEDLNFSIEDAILTKADEFISTNIAGIKPPDTLTEIELNASNTTRWKIVFERLKDTGQLWTGDRFIEGVKRLGELNRRNPSVENIFFEASKFISKSDKQAALTLYLHYLYLDLKSAKFDNKKLTKTIQKSLFSTNEQLRDFEKVVSDLMATKDLNKALAAVPAIYEAKRKRIRLDRGAIQNARHKHAETVDLLNEYLRDEFEDNHTTITTAEVDDEVRMEITAKFDTGESDTRSTAVDFTPVQLRLLELFVKNSFTAAQADVENFARENGAFKNQVIESLNEACYEFLDDVLIEEDDDLYVVNEEYYRTVVRS